MYPAVLFLHSWLRWLVLLAAVVVLVRAVVGWFGGRRWREADLTSARIFVALLDVQLLLGLVLYAGVSPIVSAALADFGAAMRDGLLRYWAVEHAFGMLAAVVIAHVGLVRAKRARGDAARHRAAAISTGLALLVIVLSLPWPGFAYARPLLRW